MEGVWVAAPTGPSLRLRATNNSPEPLTGWMIQFNKNAHGLSPATQSVAFGSIPAGEEVPDRSDHEPTEVPID
jgi:hypothetical protein